MNIFTDNNFSKKFDNIFENKIINIIIKNFRSYSKYIRILKKLLNKFLIR